MILWRRNFLDYRKMIACFIHQNWTMEQESFIPSEALVCKLLFQSSSNVGFPRFHATRFPCPQPLVVARTMLMSLEFWGGIASRYSRGIVKELFHARIIIRANIDELVFSTSGIRLHFTSTFTTYESYIFYLDDESINVHRICSSAFQCSIILSYRLPNDINDINVVHNMHVGA